MNPSNLPVAIVTGAGSGIGRATAIELSRLEYVVVLAGRTRETLEQTASLLSTSREIHVADISLPHEASRLVASALERFGRIDALINNAGFAPVTMIPGMTPDEWDKVIATNLSAPFYLTHFAWNALSKQGGIIVNVSSISAKDPFPGFAAYGAAKAGLNLLGLSAAKEGEPVGIRVHTIAPAATETAMFRAIPGAKDYPAEKTLDPADVARVIGLCVRGELRYASGEVIYLQRSLR